MAFSSIDPALLQRVRLAIAAQTDEHARLETLADVGGERLHLHLERLFYGGEIAGDCRMVAGALRLAVRGLTPYGVLAMHAELARDPTIRRDA